MALTQSSLSVLPTSLKGSGPVKHIAVIGGGPAGYPCAIRLAQHGFQVTLIESQYLGGTCLNWGCIPSKALIKQATLAKTLKAYGHEQPFDWPTLRDQLQQPVQTLRNGVAARLKRLKIKVIQGRAHFESPTELIITDLQQPAKTQHLKPDAIVIATGAKTFTPPIFQNLDPTKVFGVETFFTLPNLPESLGIIGAGVIGIEIAQALARLGVAVHVIERLPNLLPAYDKRLVEKLVAQLKSDGVQLHLETEINECTVNPQGVTLTGEKASNQPFSLGVGAILVAPGRLPNTEGLSLTNAAVHTDARGAISVNDQFQTSQASIFAVGDVASGSVQLAHYATHQALTLADTLAGKAMGKDPCARVPAVIYTQPELARVGLSLAEAKAQFPEAKLCTFPFVALGRAHIEQILEGEVGIIYDPESGVLLGADVYSDHADLLISQMTQALELGATLEDIALTMHPHPGLSEAWLEVAERALGHGVHID
jgi:dihydrolipoamide dehydrogenase